MLRPIVLFLCGAIIVSALGFAATKLGTYLGSLFGGVL